MNMNMNGENKNTDYYVISPSIMENIAFYTRKLSNNLSYNKLQNLNVNDIHTNQDNVIDNFMNIFNNALEEEEEEEDRDNLYEIVDALNKRKNTIQQIKYDVLKRREECCCY